MAHYTPHGLSVTIEDDGLLNAKLTKRMLTDSWEPAEAKALVGLNPYSSVLDIGGCIGIISCVANKLLADSRQHVVIEANPYLIKQLTAVRNENDCLFEIENCLISNAVGSRSFYVHPDHIMGGSAHSTHARREIQVEQTTISELESKYSMSFDVLVMDIEHGEYELFEECLLPNNYFLKFHTLICEFHRHDDKTVPLQGVRGAKIEKTLAAHGYAAKGFGDGVVKFTQ